MTKIHYEKTVKANINRVFEIATDYESFQKILPQYFPSVRVRSSRDNVTVVEQHMVIAGHELVMMTKHIVSLPALHEIFVIGGDAKGSHISEKYETTPDGTKITLDAELKLKGMLKIEGFFSKSKIQNSFGKLIDEFANIAEN